MPCTLHSERNEFQHALTCTHKYSHGKKGGGKGDRGRAHHAVATDTSGMSEAQKLKEKAQNEDKQVALCHGRMLCHEFALLHVACQNRGCMHVCEGYGLHSASNPRDGEHTLALEIFA